MGEDPVNDRLVGQRISVRSCYADTPMLFARF
jgi:hypothetical protein